MHLLIVIFGIISSNTVLHLSHLAVEGGRSLKQHVTPVKSGHHNSQHHVKHHSLLSRCHRSGTGWKSCFLRFKLPTIQTVFGECGGNLEMQEAGTPNVSTWLSAERMNTESHKDLRGTMQDRLMQGSYIGGLRLSLRTSSDWFCRRRLR